MSSQLPGRRGRLDRGLRETDPASRSRAARSSGRAAWVAAGVLVLGAIVFLSALDSVTELGTTVRADRSLVDFAVAHRTAWLTDVARAWTFLGSGWIVAPVTTLAVILLTARRRLAVALTVAASTAGTALAVNLVKTFVARPRPPTGEHLVTAVGAAFPSGHAAQSVACYAALACAVTALSGSRAVRVAAWSGAAIIALGVGWSRVYLGVHWPSDVLGGWSLASAWLAALVLASILVTSHRAGRV